MKKVKSHPKTAILGNKNREQSRKELFCVKTVSSRELSSFEASGRPKNLNWVARMRRWFM